MLIYCEVCDAFVWAESEDMETYTCPECHSILEEVELWEA